MVHQEPKRSVNRREFITHSAVLGGAALLGPKVALADGVLDWFRADAPRSIPDSANRVVEQEFEARLQVVAGRLPSDLSGHVFLMNPASRPNGGPLFNANGMVLRVDFDGNAQPLAKQAVVKTPCYYAENSSSLGLFSQFRDFGMIRASPLLGARNQLNTAFLPMKGRILATHDAGRPWWFDPASLEMLSPVGSNEEWEPAIPQIPGMTSDSVFPTIFTSAHPAYDAYTDEYFGINYGNIPGRTPFTYLVRWNGQGALEKFDLREPNGNRVHIRQSCHQLVITRDHVVFADTSFRVELEQALFNGFSTPVEPRVRGWVVRRADLAAGRSVEARPFSLDRECSHFMADFDDSDGVIRLWAAHHNGVDPSEWVRSGDRVHSTGKGVRREHHGFLMSPTDVNPLAKVELGVTSGRVTVLRNDLHWDERWGWGIALGTHTPAGWHQGAQVLYPGRLKSLFWNSMGFHPEILTNRAMRMYASHPFRRVSVAALPAQPRRGSIFRWDTESNTVADGYLFPERSFSSSPTYIPRRLDREDATGTDGYVLMSVAMDGAGGRPQDEIWIFDAKRLADGPVCRLGHTQLDFAFSLHSAWVPILETPRMDGAVPVAEDLRPRVNRLPSGKLRRAFETEVYPRFR